MKCCFCGNEIIGYGNNPDGAAIRNKEGVIIFPKFIEGERCCDACDSLYVIPGRLYTFYTRINKTNKETKK